LESHFALSKCNAARERAKAKRNSRNQRPGLCNSSLQGPKTSAVNRRSQREELSKLKGEENWKRGRENRILHSYNRTFSVASKLSESGTLKGMRDTALFLSQN